MWRLWYLRLILGQEVPEVVFISMLKVNYICLTSSPFIQTHTFTLNSCDDVSNNLLKIIVINIGLLCMTGFFVRSTILLIQKKVLQKIIPPGPREVAQGESSILIKVFMNYIQIVQALFTFNLQIPSVFGSIFQYSSSPIESATYAMDCLLVGIAEKFGYENEMLYFRIISAQVQIILFVIVF